VGYCQKILAAAKSSGHLGYWHKTLLAAKHLEILSHICTHIEQGVNRAPGIKKIFDFGGPMGPGVQEFKQ